jgi:hypothetical protein
MVHPPHPTTEPYSLTHLPVASMWVIAPTTSFRGARAIFQAKPFHVLYPTFSTAVAHHTYLLLEMEQTECSETLAFKLQMLGNNPEESILHKHLCFFVSFYVILHFCYWSFICSLNQIALLQWKCIQVFKMVLVVPVDNEHQDSSV